MDIKQNAVKAVIACVLLAGGVGVTMASDRTGSAHGEFQIAQSNQWYAIGGAFSTKANAQRRVNELGPDYWYPFWSNECPNFTPGYWIAVAGPYPRGRAQAFASHSSAAYHGAYVKSCY